jgi:chaperonin cofactor prefoldin
LFQIQQTAVQSQRALSVTRQQVASKERERRILQLTKSEIGQTEDSVNVYRGVGKMYYMVPLAYPSLPNVQEKVYDDSPIDDGERPQKSGESFDRGYQQLE